MNEITQLSQEIAEKIVDGSLNYSDRPRSEREEVNRIATIIRPYLAGGESVWNEAIVTIKNVEERDPECNTWHTDCVAALEQARDRGASPDEVCTQCEANARSNEAGGYTELAAECRAYCRRGHRAPDEVGVESGK